MSSDQLERVREKAKNVHEMISYTLLLLPNQNNFNLELFAKNQICLGVLIINPNFIGFLIN